MPTRGMTGSATGFAGVGADFNSHAHEGHDKTFYEILGIPKISTHMPTRGMTLTKSEKIVEKIKFQLTCPRGA